MVPEAPTILRSGESPAHIGRVSQTDAGCEVTVSRWCQRTRYTRISRINNAGGSGGKHLGLLPGNKRDVVVIFLIPGLDTVPAQTVIQCEIAFHAPAVFRVDARVLVPAIEGSELVLSVDARNADDEIREVEAGLLPGNVKAAIQIGERIRVDLVVFELSPHFD